MAAATITTSIVTGGTNSHATTAQEVNGVATDFVQQGVVGTISNTSGVAPNTGSFAVNAQGTPAMFVDITAGTAYITATPSGQASQVLRAYMSASYTSYTITANSSGSTKYDWIYLQVDATKANNPASDASDVTSIVTSRSSSNTADNGTPPTYGILLAVVTVTNGASSISNSNVVDGRTRALVTSNSLGWTPASGTWAFSSYDSTNKTGVITVNSDATTIYSQGMRVRFTNNGSTQYGIITKVASTALTVYFGTDYSLTSGTIAFPYYSYQKAPFAFPLDPAKWTVTTTDTSDRTTTSTTPSNVGSVSISVPIGVWELAHSGNAQTGRGSTTFASGYVTLSATSTTEDDTAMSTFFQTQTPTGTIQLNAPFSRRKFVTVTSATSYYQNIWSSASSITTSVMGATGGKTTITARCALL